MAWRPPRPGRLQAERADNALLKSEDPWECDQAALPPIHDDAAARDLIAALTGEALGAPGGGGREVARPRRASPSRPTTSSTPGLTPPPPPTTSATCIGYASTIYLDEINTTLLVQSVTLWTGGAGSDPWNQASTVCGLMEFGRYWNLNRTGVTRTIAHFLSGKNLGGGIAWLGVLCSGPFGASASCPGLPADAPWGGAYGFTANISGNFNINNPTVVCGTSWRSPTRSGTTSTRPTATAATASAAARARSTSAERVSPGATRGPRACRVRPAPAAAPS
jgi:hypothetical protein